MQLSQNRPEKMETSKGPDQVQVEEARQDVTGDLQRSGRGEPPSERADCATAWRKPVPEGRGCPAQSRERPPAQTAVSRRLERRPSVRRCDDIGARMTMSDRQRHGKAL